MTTPDFSIIQRDIKTRDDADAALGVLDWVALRRQKLQAELDLKFSAEVAKSREAMKIDCDGASFSFDEVEKALKQSLLKFADANRASLFVPRKTAKLTNGELRSRKQQASVELGEGVTAEAVLTRLAAHPRYVRTTKVIDFSSIQTDREKDLLTDEQLMEFGLVYAAAGPDSITVVPNSAKKK